MLKKWLWTTYPQVQKAPVLLDQVHRLMESKKLRFVLSASSARKLRRGGSNLLAGRAITISMFPLVSAEMSFAFDVRDVLVHGTFANGRDP